MIVKYRRYREGKTNYRKRLALVKSGLPRLVIRRHHNSIVAQAVNYDPKGDKVLTGFVSTALKKYGWDVHTGNLPSAYLTGYMLGLRAKKKGIKKMVLDLGLQRVTKGSALFACLKGVLDAGIDVPHGEHMLPDENRLYGGHISEEIKSKIDNIKSKVGKDGLDS